MKSLPFFQLNWGLSGFHQRSHNWIIAELDNSKVSSHAKFSLLLSPAGLVFYECKME